MAVTLLSQTQYYDGYNWSTDSSGWEIRVKCVVTGNNNPAKDGDKLTVKITITDDSSYSNFSYCAFTGDFTSISAGSEVTKTPTFKRSTARYNSIRIKCTDSSGSLSTSVSFKVPVENTTPTATFSIPTLMAGQSAKISWTLSDAEDDDIDQTSTLYRYYKAVGATRFTSTSISINSYTRSYTDTIPESYAGGQVYYQLKLQDTFSDYVNVKSDTYTVLTNTAPGSPGIPSFATEVKGGEALAVSWTAATDVDGNLSGYILETQLDGGSWAQIYKGSARTYSYTVSKGTETIAFRVKAYDSYNAESAYATSSMVAVSNDIIGIQGANAIISGVQKDLTGVGYVCIAGIWKSLVNSYTCIDGIWKSMMGGADLADLPDGYIQLEYIESSGTQYIDTGFTPNKDTRIDISVMAFSTANAGAGTGFIPYGAGVNYNSNAFECYTSGEQLEFNYANEKAYVCDAITNSIYNISHNKAAVSVTGAAEASYTFPYTAISVPRTMTLFAINRATVLISDSMRLYSCQIYDNDVLIRDFVPCMNSSGEIGLYDMVNKMFYSNAGTGVFTAGKPASSTFYPLPGDFTSAEYIQSSGAQWIDTGFKPNANTRIVMDVENLTATASTGYFGTRSAVSSTNTYACVFFTNTNGESNMRLDYYGSTKTVSCNSLQRLLLDWNKNVTTIGDVTTVTNTASTNSSTYNLYLLAINTAGSTQFGANAKLYSCQIYDNGILIRDYIPCANPNGEAGLWDKVNGVFYGNSGSGEFLINGELPSGYTQVEYIQSSGTQYINTGFIPNQDSRFVLDIDIANKSAQQGIFGSRYAYKNRAFILWTYTDNAGFEDAYASEAKTGVADSSYGRHVIDKNKNSLYIDNVLVNTFTYTTFTTPANAFLLAINSNGTPTTGTYPLSAKLYSCRIYDNGVLIRDFIPCTNTSGTAGLYDVVNGVFYTNAGTGEFTAG